MAKAKAKKEKPLYDKNGQWVEERGRIKGAIRRSFRLSPQMKEVLKAARVELSPALKKDGTPGKRPRVRYTCAHCKELWSQKDVNVDHIHTVVPLWKKEENMTYDEIVRGVFCDKSNLQVLCSIAIKKNDGKHSCHKKKTDEENWVRRELMRRYPDNQDLRESSCTDSIKELWADYQNHLKEKEAKKNAKRGRSAAKKRKGNSKPDQRSARDL